MKVSVWVRVLGVCICVLATGPLMSSANSTTSHLSGGVAVKVPCTLTVQNNNASCPGVNCTKKYTQVKGFGYLDFNGAAISACGPVLEGCAVVEDGAPTTRDYGCKAVSVTAPE